MPRVLLIESAMEDSADLLLFLLIFWGRTKLFLLNKRKKLWSMVFNFVTVKE